MEEPIENPKSVVAAVLLALFFGPIGMIYVRRGLRSFEIVIGFGLLMWVTTLALGLQPGQDHPIPIIGGLLFLVYFLVVQPWWAAKRAKAINRGEA
ncbi:MAG: hypothetical protein PHX83_04150 [Acidobacteriia bacterium]|nr:hypothetical protein [Terriglobia bacterium]